MIDHEAGHDLDRLIAEKVMGWKPVKSPGMPPFGQGSRIEPGQVYTVDGIPPSESEAPPYSTDIALSWEVVEKMREEGFSFRLSQSMASGRWHCEIFCGFGPCEKHGNKESLPHGARVAGATAPLSICRTALAALSR